MEIKLTGHTVHLKEKMTWGMVERIRTSLMGGFDIRGAKADQVKLDPKALSEAKYFTLETCVERIEDAEGKEVKFSRDWMDGLSVEDGDALYSAVNDFSSPKA